jgi:hypothetical protein
VQKHALKKIPVSKNRQLWVRVSRRNNQIWVELRVHHSTLNGVCLATRQGFEIPISKIDHLQQTLSELLQAAKIVRGLPDV